MHRQVKVLARTKLKAFAQTFSCSTGAVYVSAEDCDSWRRTIPSPKILASCGSASRTGRSYLVKVSVGANSIGLRNFDVAPARQLPHPTYHVGPNGLQWSKKHMHGVRKLNAKMNE